MNDALREQSPLLSVRVDASDRHHVLHLEGELDLWSSGQLGIALDRVLSSATAVVLDLRGVSFMDSSGLAAVLNCRRRCEQGGVPCTLTSSTPQVQRLFERTGVLKAFAGR